MSMSLVQERTVSPTLRPSGQRMYAFAPSAWMQKSNTSGTVRIVLSSSDLGWDIILATLEVDTTVLALVATTLAGSDAADIVVA